MTTRVPPDVGPSTDADSLTRAYDVLANTRRRRVVRYLEGHQSMSLATLADGVAEQEASVPLHEVDAQTVRSVYLSLYHAHLPVLEDASVVRYDQQRDWVALRDTQERDLVMSLLDAAPPAEDGSN